MFTTTASKLLFLVSHWVCNTKHKKIVRKIEIDFPVGTKHVDIRFWMQWLRQGKEHGRNTFDGVVVALSCVDVIISRTFQEDSVDLASVTAPRDIRFTRRTRVLRAIRAFLR